MARWTTKKPTTERGEKAVAAFIEGLWVYKITATKFGLYRVALVVTERPFDPDKQKRVTRVTHDYFDETFATRKDAEAFIASRKKRAGA